MAEPDAGPPSTPGQDAVTDGDGAVVTIDQMRAGGYLDDLATRSMAWIRAERAAVGELENQISYVRRLVQGRLDIVAAEQRHRLDGDDHDLHSLVDQLPEILGDRVHAPGNGRLTSVLSPGSIDPVLAKRMAEAAPDAVLTRLTEVDDAELTLTADRLTQLEADVSGQRRVCHEALDRLGTEVVERYRNGEASVDSLLP